MIPFGYKKDQYSKEGPKTRIEALRKARSRQKDLMMEKISYQKKMLKETLDILITIENEAKMIRNCLIINVMFIQNDTLWV